MRLDPARRRAVLIAGIVWIVLGVALAAIGGGAGGFTPDDPVVPRIGFLDAGNGKVAIVVGTAALRQAKGIEVRTGSEAQSGRMLWKAHRRADAAPGDGVVVIGTLPDGFTEDQPFEAALPRRWHAEVDNACFYASAVAPDELSTQAATLENGDRVSVASITGDDTAFSPCGSGSFADRAGLFVGLVSIAIGGVLLVVLWFDLRRRLPAELAGREPGRGPDDDPDDDPVRNG